MANVYDFRSGRGIVGMSPKVVGEELERIQKENDGALKPENVVEAATPVDAPLHPAFEWDDSAAAHQYRLHQARRVITSVRILNGPDAGKNPSPVYVSIRSPEHGRTYQAVAEVLGEEQLKARFLDEVRRAIESLERRYSHFEELAGLIANVKKAVG